MFLQLLARYLSIEPVQDASGRDYPHLHGKVELLAYCLMGNHFHMLLYQVEEGAMKTLMQSLMSSYTRYFNKTHKRSGPLFESRYKAAMIYHQNYLEHISRYIHLNRKDWQTYRYSSIHNYLYDREDEWLQPERILELFNSKQEYKEFVSDYVEYKQMLDLVKYELADN
jgi:putative transposase